MLFHCLFFLWNLISPMLGLLDLLSKSHTFSYKGHMGKTKGKGGSKGGSGFGWDGG